MKNYSYSFKFDIITFIFFYFKKYTLTSIFHIYWPFLPFILNRHLEKNKGDESIFLKIERMYNYTESWGNEYNLS